MSGPLSYDFASLAKIFFAQTPSITEGAIAALLQEVYIVGLRDGYAAGLIGADDLDAMILTVRLVGAPFTCGEKYGKDRQNPEEL